MTSTPAAPPSAASTPLLECDLVMKGGITSGVVYPLAVCELATVYRLRSVGGSSAGAIAAAAAAAPSSAAARAASSGWPGCRSDLTEPVEGENSRLFTLFQPQPTMRRLFGLVTAGLGTAGRARTRAMLARRAPGWLPYAAGRSCSGVAVFVIRASSQDDLARWVLSGRRAAARRGRAWSSGSRRDLPRRAAGSRRRASA